MTRNKGLTHMVVQMEDNSEHFQGIHGGLSEMKSSMANITVQVTEIANSNAKLADMYQQVLHQIAEIMARFDYLATSIEVESACIVGVSLRMDNMGDRLSDLEVSMEEICQEKQPTTRATATSDFTFKFRIIDLTKRSTGSSTQSEKGRINGAAVYTNYC